MYREDKLPMQAGTYNQLSAISYQLSVVIAQIPHAGQHD
jgi:hypothetical protein